MHRGSKRPAEFSPAATGGCLMLVRRSAPSARFSSPAELDDLCEDVAL
eukprot:CAMPEP_0184263548 /NCGR_PEP_ID=MMETSP0977-20130417/19405_1 /TAXON_ID=483370 /ORGANISM="non described non described, Strain CCMP2097" /LENGTH=47 /DNA_ID= /DNA_START= /DNA_END= /DNA_ORIENTATION=